MHLSPNVDCTINCCVCHDSAFVNSLLRSLFLISLLDHDTVNGKFFLKYVNDMSIKQFQY